MITIIIVGILSFILFWFVFAKADWELPTAYERTHPIYRVFWCTFRNFFPIFSVALAATLTFSIVWTGISLLICSNDTIPTTLNLTKTEKIVSLSDRPHEYIWRRLSEDSVDFVYVTPTDKGYKIKTVNAADTYIQNSPEKRCAEYYHRVFENSFLRHFLVNMYSDVVIFYVPKGTVVSNYNIDLKGN